MKSKWGIAFILIVGVFIVLQQNPPFLSRFRFFQGYIHGQVVGFDGQPIDAATVALVGRPMSVQTSMDGRFDLAVFPGTYDLIITKPGHMDVGFKQVKVGRAQTRLIASLGNKVIVMHQMVTIIGSKVVDTGWRALNEAAVVMVDHKGVRHDFITTTGGRFDIVNVVDGLYDVSVTKKGYKPTAYHHYMVKQEAKPLTIIMKKLAGN